MCHGHVDQTEGHRDGRPAARAPAGPAAPEAGAIEAGIKVVENQVPCRLPSIAGSARGGVTVKVCVEVPVCVCSLLQCLFLRSPSHADLCKPRPLRFSPRPGHGHGHPVPRAATEVPM